MSDNSIGKDFSKELQSEVRASRRCLEAIPDKLYKYKPHEKSMELGYLALLVADMPRWIIDMIEKSVIDLATYQRFELSTPDALVKYFDDNVAGAKRTLERVSDKDLEGIFELKVGGKVVMSSSKKVSVRQTINHWVHHRGQLTVYMRLNDIAVPSIYGPSADERTF
ncbi:MAG: DinB family protein [Bacteroidota bacterium]|nr:DinB family protein [Bacteroidota bacterium]